MEAATTPQSQAAPPPRLRERYEQEVAPALTRKFGYSTPMQLPRLRKIVLNMGVGEAKQNAKMLEAAQEQLATIAGQQPSVRRARKSIASFKVREGMPVGLSVTLRRARMWEFLDRLTSIAVPRIRDFRGLNPRSFDGRGNYSMGVREQLIFPEIDYDSIDEVRGLDVTIATSAQTDVEAFELLLGLGMPFAKEGRPGSRDAEAEAEAEEERRKEEARQRAEAEQAALEQLKEENPEAYAKPEPTGPDAEVGVSEAALGSSPEEQDGESAESEGRGTDAASASDTPSSVPPAGDAGKAEKESSNDG
jgi:large subunit ribosomal protein L5